MLGSVILDLGLFTWGERIMQERRKENENTR